MVIQDPQFYTGQTNKDNTWINQENVWIVNGEVNKVDSHFRVEFLCNRIGETNLYLGNQPLYENDFKTLADNEICGVLSLSSETEDHNGLREQYQNRGIDRLYNYYIPEFNTIDELTEKLLNAANLLNTINNDL